MESVTIGVAHKGYKGFWFHLPHRFDDGRINNFTNFLALACQFVAHRAGDELADQQSKMVLAAQPGTPVWLGRAHALCLPFLGSMGKTARLAL